MGIRARLKGRKPDRDRAANWTGANAQSGFLLQRLRTLHSRQRFGKLRNVSYP
jgi:hypothetical protein